MATGQSNGIQDIAAAKWRSSGISDAQAKILKLRGLTERETKSLGASFHETEALFIPYFDLRGKKTRFYRIRYLGPLPGFAGQAKNPQRFAQEPTTLNEVYLPPLLSKSWEEISKDKSDLYITEGELKAASGCAAGLPVLGIGGVDVWRSAKRGVVLLPALEKFVWRGRRVNIVYDSDAATNPNVVRAQRSLAKELLSRGAHVEITNIPPGATGKQGLDDFIVAHGSKGLETLVSAPFPESDALWSFNEEVLLIPKMSVVVERSTGHLSKVKDWVAVIAANRHYQNTIFKGKNVSFETKPLAPRWVEWEHRAEAKELVYEPGQPHELPDQWNMWEGWGCEPRKGDLAPWHWLMEFLFKDEHESRRWFERWLAYPLQNPGAKLYTAVLLWSHVQGMGKTLIAYAMKRIYGSNFVEIKAKDLKGTFNTWARNRQFVYGDEISSRETKIDTEWLKGVITQESMSIEEKYIPKYTVQDHMNYYFQSNHPDALFIEDRDRRFFVHEILGASAARGHYEAVDWWLKGRGPAALFRYLLDMNLGRFNPREHAMDTPGKRNMILRGKNDVQLWVQQLVDDARQALRPLGESISQDCDLFTSRQLFRACDPDGRSRSGESAMGRALASAGYQHVNNNSPVMTAVGPCRIMAVRNSVAWERATRSEIAAHFNRFWAQDSKERKL